MWAQNIWLIDTLFQYDTIHVQYYFTALEKTKPGTVNRKKPTTILHTVE